VPSMPAEMPRLFGVTTAMFFRKSLA
jgi:hypothetical protein